VICDDFWEHIQMSDSLRSPLIYGETTKYAMCRSACKLQDTTWDTVYLGQKITNGIRDGKYRDIFENILYKILDCVLPALMPLDWCGLFVSGLQF